ncbi:MULTISPECIES: hypothetical protein [unclassified Virgibacillus]|uniref:hypothetical protein n=1 Tax=unclassified Virgibacillus TaxID=2620237 RepID=UPI0012EB2B32|nr:MULTISPECIES: hypothetical protein [unclassified Virgibacillus]MBS7428170.1 hypothetical protein [Virgibacillus sp. 19R1-5]
MATIEHPEISRTLRTGYPKYKGEIKMPDLFTVRERVEEILSCAKELKEVSNDNVIDFYSLDQIATWLKDDIELLISMLQD